MDKDDDPIAAFGSIEEGDEPLKAYMDPTLFDTIEKQAQIDLLTPVFDAITLAGVDFDLKAQDSATGKRYILLKDEAVIDVFVMDTNLTNNILNTIEKHKEDDL
ncbi:hypothetical protein [Psychrobacter sp. DAB_AL43B]|uniref:hypothetical protein n=1 Tax=Psychrobacter sp. DAB_AL43B TaxID=1028416 RepID=UPI0009A5DC54|nr:hypothetical protein [Psychrobacter sp. DAB_AL43B]SLJ84143.1 hypothetical protein DABAL43B_0945 [Psychrobacter sp. DAB_AL43B]